MKPSDSPSDRITSTAGHSRRRREPFRGTLLASLAATSLRVVEFRDPSLTNAPGVDDHSFEQFWLPMLGPSTVCLVRILDRELAQQPQGCVVELDELAIRLGLGYRQSGRCSLSRAVERGILFGFLHRRGEMLAVRRRVPPLSQRFKERLPDALLGDYIRWETASRTTISGSGRARDG